MKVNSFLRGCFFCISYGIVFLIVFNTAFGNNPPNPNPDGQLLSSSSPDKPLSPEKEQAKKKLKEAIKKAIKEVTTNNRTKSKGKSDLRDSIDKAIEEANGNLEPDEISRAAAEAVAETLNESYGDDPDNNDGRNPVNPNNPNSLTGDDVVEATGESLEENLEKGTDARKDFNDVFKDAVPDCGNYRSLL